MRGWGLIWALGVCARSNPDSFRGVDVYKWPFFLTFKILALLWPIG